LRLAKNLIEKDESWNRVRIDQIKRKKKSREWVGKKKKKGRKRVPCCGANF
jgi:hypothetical protein